MSEIEFEEIPGLPGKLPAGESILWRGAPSWRGLAWRAFHVREALFWFSAAFIVRTGLAIWHGNAVLSALRSELWIAPVCVLSCAILSGLALAAARTTIYTITDRRIVLRTGIALPTTINLPFAQISDAKLRLFDSGTGDISVSFTNRTRLAWLVLWPHIRPWRVSKPEPMLRSVPHAAQVANLLSQALGQAAGVGGFVRNAAVASKGTVFDTVGVGAAT